VNYFSLVLELFLANQLYLNFLGYFLTFLCFFKVLKNVKKTKLIGVGLTNDSITRVKNMKACKNG